MALFALDALHRAAGPGGGSGSVGGSEERGAVVIVVVVVLVVGSSGGWMIPHSRLAGARAIRRQGCLHPETDFARKAQFHANSLSGATGVPWRAPGPGSGGVVVVVGGIRWQQAEDESAEQDRPPLHDPPRGRLRAGCALPCCWCW